MTRMCDMKVGDIVSVEQAFTDSLPNVVGKIHIISNGKNSLVSIQIGGDKFKTVELSHCWNATPTQRKQYFVQMLKGG